MKSWGRFVWLAVAVESGCGRGVQSVQTKQDSSGSSAEPRTTCSTLMHNTTPASQSDSRSSASPSMGESSVNVLLPLRTW